MKLEHLKDRRTILGGVLIVLTLALATGITGHDGEKMEKDDWREEAKNEEAEVATFAGGCFWCIEAIYQDMEGVKSAVSGYAGGSEENASYDRVKTGNTDHREAVQVEYYPSVVSYEELVEKFWQNIDPTDPGGQFSDRGQQYTTAIYYHNQEQKRIAEETKQNLSESERFEEPIVTEIEEYTTFFPAEDYHQNYSEKRTAQYKAYRVASGRQGFIKRVWDRVN